MKEEIDNKENINDKRDTNIEKKNSSNLLLKVVIGVVLLIVIVVSSILIYNKVTTIDESKMIVSSDSKGYKIKTGKNGKTYKVITHNYKGEYDIQRNVEINHLNKFDTKEVMSYSEYATFCKENNIKKKYMDKKVNYIVYAYSSPGAAYASARLAEVEYNGDTATLYIWDNVYGGVAIGHGYVIVVPTKQKVEKIDTVGIYNNDEFEKYSDPNYKPELELPIAYKPIIYLYPKEEQEVSIKLGNKQLITCSYPKYTDGWNVLAKPNGDLVDLDTNKNLYALYYESKDAVNFKVEEDGFIVKGEDVAYFLEEKLSILGLSDREAEEFIVYWLPKMEANKYNYVRFASKEEIEKNMPLEINPKPDSLIRVLMVYKGLEEPIEVKEQKLESPERDGFVAIEWGGTEIK